MMNEVEFEFDENSYSMKSPYEGDSSAELFDLNLNETFSAGGSLPVCVPPGLVYVGDRQSLIIFERPPRYQRIRFNPHNREEAKLYPDRYEEFNVPLPWQIYVGEFGTNGQLNALHLYGASDEIIGIHIPELKPHIGVSLRIKNEGCLFQFPLPNIYDSNLVCLDKETSQTENTNLASKVNLMYSSVWDTCFNADILTQVDAQYNYSQHQGSALKIPGVSPAVCWFRYWQSKLIPEVLTVHPSSFLNRTKIKMSSFQLSDWFTTPSSYKLINTLQQLI